MLQERFGQLLYTKLFGVHVMSLFISPNDRSGMILKMQTTSTLPVHSVEKVLTGTQE